MKTVSVPFRFIRIEGDGYHLLASVKINGKPAKLIIDTGASRSAFDVKRIRDFVGGKKSWADEDQISAGLGTSDMKSRNIMIDKISFGRQAVKDYSAVLLDLHHVNIIYKKLGLEAIDGVLGNDILCAHQASIDYRRQKLRLRFDVS